MDFEYWPSPGMHVVWLLKCGGEIVVAVDSLAEVEKAIEDTIAAHCREQTLTVMVVRGGHGWRDFITSGAETVSYQWSMTFRDFRCGSCGHDIWNETHREVERVWTAAGDAAGRLCVGCLEQRLNRRPTPEDFVENPAQTSQSKLQRSRERPQSAQSPRPNVTFSAPIGSVDLRAFNDDGDPCEVVACPDCLPWRAEVARDPESNEIVVREWHAVECPLFQELIQDD